MDETEQVDHIIIPPEKAPEVLKGVGAIYLRDCVCRVRAKKCPPENWEVCLLFESAPAGDLQDCRKISKERALELLGTTAQRGAIFTLFYTQAGHKLTELCSCCTCCCSPLQNKVSEGNYAEYLRSNYVAATDEALCLACGSCEPACPFEARRVENGYLQLAEERCFGCGQCIDECPEEAVRLEMEPGRGVQIPGLEL
jgi:Pyruvate/2-oxoacid:ferredoxin oxidoreductase delta subunit